MSGKFKHEVGGKTITLPSLAHVPVGVRRKTRKLDSEEQMWATLEAITDAKTLEVIDALTSEQLQELLAEWQKFSGIELGESGAS